MNRYITRTITFALTCVAKMPGITKGAEGDGGTNLFEKRDRWIEELYWEMQERTKKTSRTGHMTLLGISKEIRDASEISRKPIDSDTSVWESLRQDLLDAYGYSGPELTDLIKPEYDAALGKIDTVVQTKHVQNRKKSVVNKQKRDETFSKIQTLIEKLQTPEAAVASWHDLMAGCKDMHDASLTRDRIGYLRESMFTILEDRYINTGLGGPLDTLIQILDADHTSIYRGQETLDELGPASSFEETSEPRLNETERLALCDRLVAIAPDRRDVVVWLRIKDAYLPETDSVSYGAITFYEGRRLSWLVANPIELEDAYTVKPVELLDPEVQKFRASDEPDAYFGFPNEPLVVYVRVSLVDVPIHKAEEEARTLLQAVLDVSYLDDNQWNVMGGHLRFVSGSFFYRALEWGRREPFEGRLFIENDHTLAKLKTLDSAPKTINQDSIEDAQPILKLINDVLKTKHGDLESVIMASVRSAEHVKSWVAGEGPPWSTFVNNYLADATLKLRLRIMVGNYLHSAATNPPSHYPPDYEAEAMLRHVQDEAEEERGAYNIVAISKHLDQLRKVQKDTALARPLRDLALILKDSASVQAHFDSDRKRIITLAQRLRRSRNAAVHGGVLSLDAYDSMANFSFDLALQALNVAMRSIFEGVDKKTVFEAYRTDNSSLLDEFVDSLDLNVLYQDTALRKTKKVPITP